MPQRRAKPGSFARKIVLSNHTFSWWTFEKTKWSGTAQFTLADFPDDRLWMVFTWQVDKKAPPGPELLAASFATEKPRTLKHLDLVPAVVIRSESVMKNPHKVGMFMLELSDRAASHLFTQGLPEWFPPAALLPRLSSSSVREHPAIRAVQLWIPAWNPRP